MRHSFQSNFSTIARIPGNYTVGELEQEVGVYSATPEFVDAHCGPIANAILSRVPDAYYAEAAERNLHPNIDVRVHRLYPNDYPAYPGWHCDGQYRETYFGQPETDRTQVAQHIVCSVSTVPQGTSNTQLLCEDVEFDHAPSDDHTLWAKLDQVLNAKQEKTVYDARDGEMVQFDCWTPHRAMPTKIRGWRLFFRMAMWYRPNLGNGGMISKQEQVYQLVGSSGW